MATTDAIERLYKLSVDGGQAIAQLNKMAKATDETNKQLQQFAKSFTDFKNKVIGGFVVLSRPRHSESLRTRSSRCWKVGRRRSTISATRCRGLAFLLTTTL
jgi:hypothetical protein